MCLEQHWNQDLESIFKVFLPKNFGLFSGENIFLYAR